MKREVICWFMNKYWYNNNLNEIIIKEGEKVPDGYIQGRLKRDSKITQLQQKISKSIINELYIINNLTFIQVCNYLNISTSDLRRLLNIYKIKKDPKKRAINNHFKRNEEQIREVALKSSNTQRLKWQLKSEEELSKISNEHRIRMLNLPDEVKKAKADKFRKTWFSKTVEERSRINELRRSSCKRTWSDTSLIAKRKETEKHNRKARGKCLFKSLAEQSLYNTLVAETPDILYDVKDDQRYPWYCDFYIPSLDLFIELNAHPSHGRLPLEVSSDEYIRDFPEHYRDTFLRRDVIKNQWAITHNLNYIRIYPNASLEENYTINNHKFIHITTLCYQSQHKPQR